MRHIASLLPHSLPHWRGRRGETEAGGSGNWDLAAFAWMLTRAFSSAVRARFNVQRNKGNMDEFWEQMHGVGFHGAPGQQMPDDYPRGLGRVLYGFPGGDGQALSHSMAYQEKMSRAGFPLRLGGVWQQPNMRGFGEGQHQYMLNNALLIAGGQDGRVQVAAQQLGLWEGAGLGGLGGVAGGQSSGGGIDANVFSQQMSAMNQRGINFGGMSGLPGGSLLPHLPVPKHGSLLQRVVQPTTGGAGGGAGVAGGAGPQGW